MPASDSAPAEDTRGPDTKRQKLAGMQSEQEESICDQPSQNLSKLSTSELKALLHALHAAGRSEDLPLDTTGREGMIAALQAVVDEFKPAQKEDKPKRPMNPYNQYMTEHLAKYRAQHPELDEKQSFAAVAAAWKAHPSNPRRAAPEAPPASTATG